MVFSSNEFIFFLMPLAVLTNLAILVLVDRKRSKVVWAANLCLLFFSLLFYAWGEPRFTPYLFGSAVFNYLGGFCVSPDIVHSARTRKILLIPLVLVNIAFLGVFKYFNFFQEVGGLTVINKLLPESLQFGPIGYIALPIGISFFTFQAVSYLLDVYWGKVEVSRGFVSFACYLTMFPQLMAGPIVRFSDVHNDLLARNVSLSRVSAGCSRFIMGLAKKVIFADAFGRVVDPIFAMDPANLTPGFAWLGLVCYTLQIYYDFSSYSDMAIGIGGMLGVKFLENFNYPYISCSIKEFWRRWHISLSTWFRDYVYFPLGGSRAGTARTVINLLIVFSLCGLWHGAAWNFILWGTFHGFFLGLERLVARFFAPVPRIVKWLYCMFTVMMSLVLVRNVTLDNAITYYRALFGATDPEQKLLHPMRLLTTGYALPLTLIIGVVLSFPVYPFLRKKLAAFAAGPRPKAVALEASYRVLLIGLLVLSVAAIAASTFQAFIYFRF